MVTAPGMRPEWLELAGAEHAVRLQAATRLDITARRADGTPVTIY